MLARLVPHAAQRGTDDPQRSEMGPQALEYLIHSRRSISSIQGVLPDGCIMSMSMKLRHSVMPERQEIDGAVVTQLDRREPALLRYRTRQRVI